MEHEETDNRKTKKTILCEHSFKQPLYIPTYPAINPQKIFDILPELYNRKAYHAGNICLFILTQLQRKEQKGVVLLEQQELATYLGTSIGTINKAVQVLEELGIIARVSISSWKVSPEFAWVGSHVDWAEELKAMETGATYSVEVKQVYIEEQ